MDLSRVSVEPLQAIFLCFVGTVSVVNQMSVVTIQARSIYETRERPSLMYHWSAFLCAHFFSEVFWNIIGSILLVLSWYWNVGFPSSRVPYELLCLGVLYPLFYTSLGIAVAVSSPNVEVGNIVMGLIFLLLVILLVTLHFSNLPSFSNYCFQRWHNATISTARVVEVDVPCQPVHLLR